MRNDSRACMFFLLPLAMAALAALFLSAACADTQPARSAETGQDEGEKAVNLLVADPKSLDPACAYDGDTYAVNVYDRLLETRDDGEGASIESSLAESVDVSPDGLSYTFHLREGVSFSNGSPFGADDVKFTLERLARSEGEGAALVDGIAGLRSYIQGDADALEGVTVLDDATCVVTLDGRRPSFLSALSATAASILDAQTTPGMDADYTLEENAPAGTGPFKLQSYRQRVSLVMEANAACWSGKPSCEKAVLKFPSEAEPYRKLFEEGMLDIVDITAMGLDAEYFARGDSYRRNLERMLSSNITCIVMDDSAFPLSDSRVREALHAALDKWALLKAVHGGRGIVASGIIPKGLSCGASELPETPYDPAHARSLLAEAGVVDGFELGILCPKDCSERERGLVELVAEMWREVGVDVAIAPDDGAKGEGTAWPAGASCRVIDVFASYDEPESVYSMLEAKSGYPRLEAELEGAVLEASAADEDARMGVYRESERDIVDRSLIVPLFTRSQVFAVSGRVGEFSFAWNGSAGVDLRGVNVAGLRG